jgi:hypothetical protein
MHLCTRLVRLGVQTPLEPHNSGPWPSVPMHWVLYRGNFKRMDTLMSSKVCQLNLGILIDCLRLFRNYGLGFHDSPDCHVGLWS